MKTDRIEKRVACSFGEAVQALKAGEVAWRAGWYGKHTLRLVMPLAGDECNQPFIAIYAQNGDVLPWLASQADVLAEDWSTQNPEHPE